jgi:prevent-host-death family protein
VKSVSIAEAKAHLSELVDQARAGEEIEITRRGQPVALILAAPRKKKPIDIDALKAATESMPKQSTNAGEFVRWLRDTDRY